MIKYFLFLISIAFVLISCETDVPIESLSSINTSLLTEDETLIEAATFPIGNVWSAGLPPWGLTRGTDLGGPSDDFSYSAFGPYSSLPNKQIDLDKEFNILRTETNSITPEVALKMHNISISPDSIDFRQADAMVDFAEANNIRVMGHVLLFDLSIPEWAKQYADDHIWTEIQWENWLENYIMTVVGRYKGRIKAWDVLNEYAKTLGGGLKADEYFWYQVIGPDFAKKAFLWAEAADPESKLFINDNMQELFPQKNSDIIHLANDLRAQGCRVDGIGYQGHVIVPIIQGTYENFKRAFKLAADAGYLVHLSELDIISNLLGTTNYQTALQYRIQRKSYNEIARAYLDAVPPAQRWGITLWNISDKNGWTNIIRLWQDLRIFGGSQDYPVLWNNEYEKKPAYYGFKNGIRGINESWSNPPLWSSGKQSDDNEQAKVSYPFKDEKEEYLFYLESSIAYFKEHFQFTDEALNNMKRSAIEEMGSLIE